MPSSFYNVHYEGIDVVTEEFSTCNKEKQLEKIIEIMSNNGDVNGVIEFYETQHNTSFSFDLARHEYSFLQHVSLYQAIKLYDNLIAAAKKILIDVILDDHIHLYELVRIHNNLCTMNMVPSSQSIS